MVLPAPKAQTKARDKKGLHVTTLLPLLLRVKSLTINICFGVSPFLDLCVILSYMAIFDHKSVVRWLRKTESRRAEDGGRRLEVRKQRTEGNTEVPDRKRVVISLRKNSVKFHDI